MIFIERNSVKVPDILKDESAKMLKELEKAIAHYSDPENTTAFKFSVYSDASVKTALKEMSHKKCAYCESKFLKTYVGDIEHFRPKGEIEELKETNNSKPGYYWLAADWDNLLLSCRHCNQKSKHQTADDDRLRSMGKMNQFPLLDEAFRARLHTDDLKKEEEVRLLINPCKEDPEEYFKYDINIGIIKPKGRKLLKKERAKASIDVFALQRMDLVQGREKKAIEISAQMQRVEDLMFDLEDFKDDPVRLPRYQRRYDEELEILWSFLDETEEYLGLARQMIGKFMMQNFGIDIYAA